MDSRLLLVVGGLCTFGAMLTLLVHRARVSAALHPRTDWVKFAVFLLVIGTLLVTAELGRIVAAGILAIIALGGATEIYRNLDSRLRMTSAALVFLIVSLGLGHLLAIRGETWGHWFSVGIVIVASGDAFGQLWGRLLGRRRLCPRISPHKTVEGLIGGLVTATVAAVLLVSPGPEVHWIRLAALGLLTAAGGIAGDLLFSGVKRAIAIKDFSHAIPGHGGVLDRFDSLVVAAPVFYWSRLWLLG